MKLGDWIRNTNTGRVARIVKTELPQYGINVIATLSGGDRYDLGELPKTWNVVDREDILAVAKQHDLGEMYSESDRFMKDHIEKFAAAFLSLTDIPADKAAMKTSVGISPNGELITTIWFERK